MALKAQILGVRYTHPVHGVFVIQFSQDGSCTCARVHRSRHGTMATEKLAGTTRKECRASIRACVARLDSQLGLQTVTNPEPLCSGKGSVTCA